MKKNLLPLLLICLVSGCESDEKLAAADEYNYYPLRLNAPLIYQLTRTSYAAGQPDSIVTTWQEKDEMIRMSTDADGFHTYTVTRARRDTPNEYWQKQKEYTVTGYRENCWFQWTM